jgi:hypothetical protein
VENQPSTMALTVGLGMKPAARLFVPLVVHLIRQIPARQRVVQALEKSGIHKDLLLPQHLARKLKDSQSRQTAVGRAIPWNNFPSRFDSDCYTMQDDSSFSQSAFSDYSHPSSNPYYEPRKRPFTNLDDYCSFGTWAPRVPGKWAKDYQDTVQPPKHTPYWIPEPIIEEPDSPESSPSKRANILGKWVKAMLSCSNANYSQNLMKLIFLLRLPATSPVYYFLIWESLQITVINQTMILTRKIRLARAVVMPHPSTSLSR